MRHAHRVNPSPAAVLIHVTGPGSDAGRAALREDPSDDLAPPSGLFWVAREHGTVIGCAGQRPLPEGLGEVKRVFVEPAARGRRLGRRLMGKVEQCARAAPDRAAPGDPR